jgi:antitoxin MazE
METSIKKWGNSLGVRLPKKMTERHAFRDGSRVMVTETETGITIETIKEPARTLDEMVERITKNNLPGELEWGDRIGNEVW